MPIKNSVLLFSILALVSPRMFAEETARVQTIAYVASTSGTPPPCCVKGDVHLDSLKQGQQLRGIDEVQVESKCSVTLIYSDGTVETIKGAGSWKGADHALARNVDPDGPGFCERLGHYLELRHGMSVRSAGARGESAPPRLQLLCASIQSGQAGSQTGEWTGTVFWSEYSSAESNQVQLQFWTGEDLVAKAPLPGKLVRREGDQGLFRAQFSMPPYAASKISQIQVGDTARRGLGNSNPLSWQMVWTPLSPEPTPAPANDDVDTRLAEGMVLELRNQPVAALDLYLDLQQRHPERPEIQTSLALFFETSGASSIANWYFKTLPAKGSGP
jgi:hypothetical protein